MNTNILDTAVALSDRDLLARLPVLARRERSATAELVAHLAALRLRPSLYAAQGYGSLFAYCRHALRLSEDAASNRIHAARACLKYPVILDGLTSGELSLSAVRMLRPHLTTENHEHVLGRARNGRRADIERLVAELAPLPDVPSSVRKVPMPGTSGSQHVVAPQSQPLLPGELDSGSSRSSSAVRPASTEAAITAQDKSGPAAVDTARVAASSVPQPAAPPLSRPVVQPLSPGRYRVQFTIGQDAHDTLRRVQTMLRREIPDGDVGAIFERALRLLHEEVETARFGRPPKRRQERVTQESTAVVPAATRAYENRIRPGADPSEAWAASSAMSEPEPKSADTVQPKRAETGQPKMTALGRSRYIPKAVKRAVWYRDRAQCAFVSATGQRCVEREFLELHHIHPYALDGPTTVGNIALRCRRHNAYESEVVFGTRGMQQRSG